MAMKRHRTKNSTEYRNQADNQAEEMNVEKFVRSLCYLRAVKHLLASEFA